MERRWSVALICIITIYSSTHKYPKHTLSHFSVNTFKSVTLHDWIECGAKCVLKWRASLSFLLLHLHAVFHIFREWDFIWTYVWMDASLVKLICYKETHHLWPCGMHSTGQYRSYVQSPKVNILCVYCFMYTTLCSTLRHLFQEKRITCLIYFVIVLEVA